MANPTWFITAAGEFQPLAAPRACWIVRCILDREGRRHVLVRVFPQVDFQSNLAPGCDDLILLSERHADAAFQDPLPSPFYVYVSTIRNDKIIMGDYLDRRDIDCIAVARLYSDHESASRDYEQYKATLAAANAHSSRILFHGEQDGCAERELKALLRTVLAEDPNVWKAFLARGMAAREKRERVYLCVRTTTKPSRSLVSSIHTAFASLFKLPESLDIVFLTPRDENDVAQVCAPFYVRTIERSV